MSVRPLRILSLQLPARSRRPQMSGYDKANANAVLGVPEEFEPGSMLAISYPAITLLFPRSCRSWKIVRARETRWSSSLFAARGRAK